jgi:hypothetical protein
VDDWEAYWEWYRSHHYVAEFPDRDCGLNRDQSFHDLVYHLYRCFLHGHGLQEACGQHDVFFVDVLPF